MDKEHKPRELTFISELVPDWRPTRQQALWATRIAIILGLLVLIGYDYGITLWDWLKLLIIPAVIAGGTIWFNQQQRERELEVAAQRAQDDALQAYLDQMAQLMLLEEGDPLAMTKPLRNSAVGDEVRILARARTLTVLRRLSSERKRSVLDFLYEADLIKQPQTIIELGSPDSQYSAADLSGADLRDAFLASANLSGSVSGAYLSEADLRGADLTGADLIGANLSGANLIGANLIEANLIEANLIRANLSGAEGMTNEELEQQAKSLEGATMPNGQKYEDWRKKDREDGKEDEKNN